MQLKSKHLNLKFPPGSSSDVFVWAEVLKASSDPFYVASKPVYSEGWQ